MKRVRCFEAGEIAEVLSLGAEDPRRRHLEGCPRCRALALSFRDFVEPGPVPAGARSAEAAERLSQAIAREIEAGARRAASRPRTGALRRWLEGWLGRPSLRPVWVTASVVVVAGAAVIAILSRPAPESVLRGERPAALALQPVRQQPGGELRLRWEPLAGAVSYQVRLYATSLEEVARLEPVRVPETVLRREALPSGLASGTRLLWRVVALRGGDELALSPVGSLRAP